MSVTTAMQGLTAAHRETQRDKSKKAREARKTQLTGRLRRWWQMLGSNHAKPTVLQMMPPDYQMRSLSCPDGVHSPW